MCESVVGLQDEIPAASIAKVLKYIVWKKRAQDLAEVDFNVKVMLCVCSCTCDTKISPYLLCPSLNIIHIWMVLVNKFLPGLG